ncbi:MAG: hypothetical protein QN187_08295 [Armatimonadota bacterium]|nr:hypothetical protein [Armatimonadota bacterium]MDR7519277.1 hypothetical protein [Armatimonadota bacterium]MDR7551083.1 hypothetical protein [Armatimonadota bacterium]
MALPWAKEAAMLARLARDLGGFLRTPVTVETAREATRARLASREERFLRTAREMIYGYPRSPYRRLLRAAGCELGDLERLVARLGLEAALARLAADGVYVTCEEFKGRREAVRGSQRFHFTDADFDNPRVATHYEAPSGGTRGPAVAVKMSLTFIEDLATNTALALHAHGLTGHDHVIWLVAGVTPMLIYAKLGRPPLAWHYQVAPLPVSRRAGSRYLALLGRLASIRLPAPSFLDLRNPEAMAARLAGLRRSGSQVCVTTYASSAVRIAAAARELGLDLSGVWFITLGEPFTEGKRRIIDASGARALVRYAFTEAGIIGYACATPQAPDDLHFFSDRYGLVQRPRPVDAAGLQVNAFLFTSLRPSAPKILLNVESGDYGVVEQRPCGCDLGKAGLTTHLWHIRSFEKLSGEGMTFVHSDLLRVLEEVLPARFGGTGADYQILEEESDGILRLALIVSPRVGALDEDRLRRTFLEELGREGAMARAGARFWQRADTIAVRRGWPKTTPAGKVLPFEMAR